jgi:hypothetical protein
MLDIDHKSTAPPARGFNQMARLENEATMRVSIVIINPREDYEWPSPDDLELKEIWLEAQLGGEVPSGLSVLLGLPR